MNVMVPLYEIGGIQRGSSINYYCSVQLGILLSCNMTMCVRLGLIAYYDCYMIFDRIILIPPPSAAPNPHPNIFK